MIFQQKLRGVFHIIFCSKSLPLQVKAKSSIVSPYGCSPNFRWCNMEGKRFWTKHYMKDTPLIFCWKVTSTNYVLRLLEINNNNKIFQRVIFQQKLRGVFHIMFCSKPLSLQATPSKVRGAAVGGNNARFGCNFGGRGFEQKIIWRTPLNFCWKITP